MDMQMLANRAAIQDVIARYFRGIDSGSKSLVRSCFTEDVQVLYDGRPPEQGIEAVMGSLRTFQRIAKGEMQITMHFMGNFNLIRLEEQSAETETYAIAFMVPPKAIADHMAVRGLRYIDQLRQTNGEWRIVRRRHTLDWSFEATPTFASSLAQRVMTASAPA
ncbi:nuclear transport factor 2 family protein [Cupriavidus basilensis]|uniref:nuclear transport factor 2 family protein n=1 Tax=Cupriavidus basilensis TaxID=68895 RepID=UPI0023E87F4A|nr:nuclear transport factor 2 family protein [Cupriavidus basilensis]MDF3887631.1 nuclear transport factor 2 family protein [Cupriavidus basilensis]